MIYKKGKTHSSMYFFNYSFPLRITSAFLLLICIYPDGNVVGFLRLKKSVYHYFSLKLLLPRTENTTNFTFNC